ncbi:hypothetical protein NHX12_012114, partial [Muraenolepis orangiensis]
EMLVSVVPLMTLVLSRLPAGCLSINKDHMLDSDRWLSGVSEKDGYWDMFRDGGRVTSLVVALPQSCAKHSLSLAADNDPEAAERGLSA